MHLYKKACQFNENGQTYANRKSVLSLADAGSARDREINFQMVTKWLCNAKSHCAATEIISLE